MIEFMQFMQFIIPWIFPLVCLLLLIVAFFHYKVTVARDGNCKELDHEALNEIKDTALLGNKAEVKNVGFLIFGIFLGSAATYHLTKDTKEWGELTLKGVSLEKVTKALPSADCNSSGSGDVVCRIY